MIALISFKEEFIVTREEAEKLKLEYNECNKVGIDGNKLVKMSNSQYYKDELIEKDGKYYKDDKEVYDWYIKERPINYLDWVVVKEKQSSGFRMVCLKL